MAIPVMMNSTYPIQVPDVSYYQNYTRDNVRKGINFTTVRTSNPSVRAVMVKASEGDWDGYLLSDFLEQAEGFNSVGIPVIPYHFWHYEVKPADQTRRFKSVTSKLSFTPKRRMVDIEDIDNETSRNPGKTIPTSEYPVWIAKALKIANSVKSTLDAISQIDGIAPIWYGADWYQGWWTWMAGLGGMDMSWIKLYNLHCASYTAPWMYLPYGFTIDQVLFWQWTSTPILSKQIVGFPNPGSLDMNYWLKSEKEFTDWIDNPQPFNPTIAELQLRIKELEGKHLEWTNWYVKAPIGGV